MRTLLERQKVVARANDRNTPTKPQNKLCLIIRRIHTTKESYVREQGGSLVVRWIFSLAAPIAEVKTISGTNF